MATVVVAVALAVGAAILVDRLRSSLVSNRRDAAMARAADLASLADSGHLPGVLALGNQEATFAQVVDTNGRVLAASANITGEPAVATVRPSRGPAVLDVTNLPVGPGGHFGLVAYPARGLAGPVTVYTAYSLLTSDLAIRDVTLGLLVAFPIVAAVVAATTWIAVGRALRPIEAIRREVADITVTDLHRRMPTPATSDEVGRLADTMNFMLDRLEGAVRRQRAFVADASHELRSPLTGLRTQLEVALDGGAATDWPGAARDALAEEGRLERLIADLLMLARLDDTVPPVASTCDLAAVAADDVDARTGRPGPDVSFCAAAPAHVAVAGSMATRIVGNLVDNAVRHAGRAVTVTVLPVASGRVGLVVADDGPGVPVADRERVFDRFTRLDDARSGDDGGVGLGLAIVRDIARLHGGTVRFTDVDLGAEVIVELPAAGAP